MVGVVIVNLSTIEPPIGLRDSKLLTAKARQNLVPMVESWAVSHAIGAASNVEIDKLGIIGALKLASHRALVKVGLRPDIVILDGKHDWLSGPPRMPKVMMQIKGDQHCASIAAASVLAKQYRDAHMTRLAPRYPQYALEHNKGYGSAEHLAALQEHGPAQCHRRSWNLPGIGSMGE
jgi:ribonuclease HII